MFKTTLNSLDFLFFKNLKSKIKLDKIIKCFMMKINLKKKLMIKILTRLTVSSLTCLNNLQHKNQLNSLMIYYNISIKIFFFINYLIVFNLKLY